MFSAQLYIKHVLYISANRCFLFKFNKNQRSYGSFLDLCKITLKIH